MAADAKGHHQVPQTSEVPCVYYNYSALPPPSARMSRRPRQIIADRILDACRLCASLGPSNGGALLILWKNGRERARCEEGVYLKRLNGAARGGVECDMYSCVAAVELCVYRRGVSRWLVCVGLPYFIARPSPTYQRLVGQSVTMTCDAGGDPPPQLSWIKVSRTPHYPPIHRIIYDTSSHAFEVQIDTSSHGGGVRWRWVCLALRTHLTLYFGILYLSIFCVVMFLFSLRTSDAFIINKIIVIVIVNPNPNNSKSDPNLILYVLSLIHI